MGESYYERDKARRMTDEDRKAYFAGRQPYRKLCERWQELSDKAPCAEASAQAARENELRDLEKQMRQEWQKIKFTSGAYQARVWLVLRKPKAGGGGGGGR